MDLTVSPHHRLTPLAFFPKSFTWAIWALCALVFFHLGWMIFAPSDPSGTVSIWARSNTLGMMLQAIALSAVIASLATALIGRILPDAGLFGTCVGLAVAGLRGATVSSLLTSPATNGADSSSWGFWFALEAAAWAVVIIIAAAASFLTYQWCCRPAFASSEAQPAAAAQASMMSGADLLALPSNIFKSEAGAVARVKHQATAVVIGLIGVALLSMDVYARSIHHGQACFAVGLSFYAASRIAHERIPMRTPLLTLLAVPAAAVMGYLWAWAQGDGSALRTLASHVPVSVFLRTTPLVYVSVGSAAVLAGFWAAKRSVTNG